MSSDTEYSPAEDPIEFAIFDIDGPVTDLESRRIEQPEILDLTLDFIADRGCVAYNTGRAAAIAHHRVVSPLLSRARARGLDADAIARRVSVFAEKGGVSSLWDDALRQWDHSVDPAAEVPEELRTGIHGLLGSDPEFRRFMFFDSDKQTMVSVEMRHETAGPRPSLVTVDEFRPVAARFAAEARRLAASLGHDDIEIDHTTIAVDIQRRGVGKDLGARLAFGWLRRLDRRVTRVHCFGDSRSDIAMAVEASAAMSQWFTDPGERVTYVHVGDDVPIDGAFRVRALPGMYGRGTVTYLRCLSLPLFLIAPTPGA